MKSEKLLGAVCRCYAGRLGVVEKVKPTPSGNLCIGTGLDGKPWQSQSPVKVANSVAEYIESQR